MSQFVGPSLSVAIVFSRPVTVAFFTGVNFVKTCRYVLPTTNGVYGAAFRKDLTNIYETVCSVDMICMEDNLPAPVLDHIT